MKDLILEELERLEAEGHTIWTGGIKQTSLGKIFWDDILTPKQLMEKNLAKGMTEEEAIEDVREAVKMENEI